MTEAFRQGFTDMLQKIAASTGYAVPQEYHQAHSDFIPGRVPVRPSLPSYEDYLRNTGNISDITKAMINSSTAKPVSDVKPRATPYERKMAPGVASRSAG